jgi:putative oxidoreductase
MACSMLRHRSEVMMDLSLSLLVIRFAAGMLVMGHGAQKLVGVGGGPGIRKWRTMIEGMGLRPVTFWAVVSASAEFVGGVALAIGWFTPFVAAALVGNFFVAIVKVHWARGLWNQGGGFEYPLLLALIATAIGLGGPGRYSVDAALGWDTVGAAIFVPLAALAVIIDALAIRNASAPVAPRREESAPEQVKRRAA